ncbi:thiamine-phosphate diphosphorylase [Vibrio sinaloensis]|nr:thiamine-phosphate diphosphorylase [Vibrio sinaloensis]
MNKLKGISQNRIGKERIKREYDLRVLNLVGESEYQSRMAIWNNLNFTNDTVNDIKTFVDQAFSKLQQELSNNKAELNIDYNEFVITANEEINYIKGNVADTTSQYFWYAMIALMVAGTIAICV